MDELVKGSGDIQLLFKNYPLEFHEFAFLVAKGTVCANEQDRFWEMSDLIFENQATLNKQTSEIAVRELLKFWAGPKQVKLDMTAFISCIEDSKTADRVNLDMAAAERMGVEGTPAVFLEGVCGPGQWIAIENRADGVRAAIEAHKTGGVLPFSCELSDAEPEPDADEPESPSQEG